MAFFVVNMSHVTPRPLDRFVYHNVNTSSLRSQPDPTFFRTTFCARTDFRLLQNMADAKPKRNFFKKPDWLQEKAKNEAKNEAKSEVKKDATQMFARSTGTISDVIAEEKRKEQLRAEKKAARAAAKKEEDDAPDRKRRKTSEDQAILYLSRSRYVCAPVLRVSELAY